MTKDKRTELMEFAIEVREIILTCLLIGDILLWALFLNTSLKTWFRAILGLGGIYMAYLFVILMLKLRCEND